MRQLKPTIIDMIEQGYGNADIGEALVCDPYYVRNVRSRYNKYAKEKKPSRIVKPKAGTKWREIYDFFANNPRASCVEASKATGANRGSCYKLRDQYLIPFQQNPQPMAVHQVSADELELVE